MDKYISNRIALDTNDLTLINQSIGTGISGERMRNFVNDIVSN